jgi:Zn-dependent peptidase ImmA (M78 family)
MKGFFSYFSPELEKHSQYLVDFVVAHEFAHAILHDLGKRIPKEEATAGFGARPELQADTLAAELRFARPR